MAQYSSPLLDDYNRTGIVSPGLTEAVNRVKQRLAPVGDPNTAPADQQQAAPQPALGHPQEQPPAITTPGQSTPMTQQPVANPTPSLTHVPTPNEARLTSLESSPSGIGGLHHAAARIPLQILDAVGSAFLPGLTTGLPGTQLHHNMLVRQAEGAVKNDQGIQKASDESALQRAQTEHTQAEVPLAEAQTEETKQRAENLKHPPPKEEMEGKTVTTGEGIFQWNPATKRYDTKVGEAPGDKGAITHFLDKDGNAWKLNHDGSATPIKGPTGTQLQGPGKEPKEGEMPLGDRVGQFNDAFKARYQVLHPGTELPAHYVLPKDATQKDFDRTHQLLEGEEKAFGTDQTRKQTEELHRQTLAIAAQNKGEKNEHELKQAGMKSYQPALDSAERFNVMAKNYEDAVKNHDQQAMLSLLANHLGMTMGLQKGARLTKDIITEAQQSRPWLQGMSAKFDRDGILSGVTLTVPQMQQMMNLGRDRFAEDISKSRNEAKYQGVKDEGPERTPNKSTINHYLGLANGDVAKAKQLAAEDGWTLPAGGAK